MRALVLFAFFFSGFSSLVLESLWVRSLTLVFGGTTMAIVTVLTTFMGGLALGSYLGGQWSPRIRRPVRVYGLLEGGVALYALALPFVFHQLPALYAWFPTESFYLKALLRFVVCGLLLLLPTTLMGATLPVLSAFVARRGRSLGAEVGLLYSINTFGAVVGAMLGGFLFLPWLGHQKTLYLIAGALLVVATALATLGAKVEVDAPEADAPEADAPEADAPEIGAPEAGTSTADASGEKADASGEKAAPSAETAGATAGLSGSRHRLLLLCIATTGAMAMSCQVLWSRALSMVIGSSTYGFTLVLSTFLIGLAGGAAWGSWLARKERCFAWVWIVALLTSASFLALGNWHFDELPQIFAGLLRSSQLLQEANPFVLFALKAAVAAIPILLPTLLMGTFFPLALAFYNDEKTDVGKRVGTLYAANTVGSIVGSALAGFVLIPLFGLQGGLNACLVAYLLCAALLTLLLEPQDRRQKPIWGLVAAGCVLAFLIPRWDVDQMSAGHFRLTNMRSAIKQRHKVKVETLFYKEGNSATVTVQRVQGAIILKLNGKVDASSGGDATTQIAIAAAPLLFHPRPRRALIIGWGSGMTVGAALQFPLRSVTAVELEPAVLQATRFFNPYNFRPLKDPRLKVVLDDGRNYLAARRKPYDVIISEPSNPWISGVSNLFTIEYFRQTHKRLEADGIFCQWIQFYNLSYGNLLAILRSVRKVYPYLALFETGIRGGDTMLLASKKPFQRDVGVLARRFARVHLKKVFARMNIQNVPQLMAHFLLSHEEIDVILAKNPGPINTDDHNILEYFAPLDLLYALHKSATLALHEKLKQKRNFAGFFRDRGKALGYRGREKLWFGVLMVLLRAGLTDRAGEHLKKLREAAPKTHYLPRLEAMLRLLRGELPAPKVSSPGARLRAWQASYAAKPTEACLQKILPVTGEPHFGKRLSGPQWYYVGSCFARFKKYVDALYAYHHYYERHLRKRKTP